MRLLGCRNDSLLGYLKALGVLRVLAAQCESKARGSWEGAIFALDTQLPQEAVAAFFVESYAPSPVLNPWNSGAGFDGKADTASETLRRVARTTGRRWVSYRTALDFIADRYVATGRRAKYLDAGDKHGFIRELRSHCPDEMLGWLDAAVLLTSDRLAFPYLLGSGGNDGRLDFSVNFAARALDVCGDKPLLQAAELLRDSLQDTGQARLLQGMAIGQFSSRHAGGANATSGFDADSLINPWDYVLMIEGALLFSGSVGRRTDRSVGRPVFPFALRGVAGGYGSASDVEQTRGEMWLPVWEGFASLASISDLLRKGRIDLPSDGERSVVRAAAVASEAATAVVTLGVPFGLSRLERVAFVQRNGLAFSATSVGAIKVGRHYDAGIAVISRDVATWVERLRGRQLGAGAREALRRFDEQILAFPNIPLQNRARARQDLLVALADVDRAVAHTRADVPAAPRLDASVVETLNDETPIHRTAIAIASLGAARSQTDTREELREAGDDAVRTLRGMLERRIRASSMDPEWLRATCCVSSDDVALFLAFDDTERLRLNQLLRAYSLIRLGKAELDISPSGDGVAIPAAYAVLKLVFDNPDARDERILRSLFSVNASRALKLAVQRARAIHDLPYGPRDVSDVQLEDPAWTAAALAVPIDPTIRTYRRLLDAALLARLSQDQNESIGTYLRTAK